MIPILILCFLIFGIFINIPVAIELFSDEKDNHLGKILLFCFGGWLSFISGLITLRKLKKLKEQIKLSKERLVLAKIMEEVFIFYYSLPEDDAITISMKFMEEEFGEDWAILQKSEEEDKEVAEHLLGAWVALRKTTLNKKRRV